MDNKTEADSKSKGQASVHSTPGFNNALPNEEILVPTLLKGSIDPVYEGKAQVLNSAIQEIGMGRYQWQLFVVVGGSYIFQRQRSVFNFDPILGLIEQADSLTRIRLGE